MLSIQVEKRSKTDRLDVLRNNGKIPGVVYGASVPSTSIAFDKSVFEKLFKQAGESSTVEILLDGKKIQTLIHEVQHDPVKGTPVHVDFLAVDANKKADLYVPLEFIGIAPAVKNGLGNLVKVLHEVEISALPKDIPHDLKIDLSTLVDADSQILASDITLPAGVTLVTKGTEIVASIAVQEEEKEEVVVDIKNIEVEKKGKKEVEE